MHRADSSGAYATGVAFVRNIGYTMKKKVIAAAIGCAACLLVLGMFALGFFIGKKVYDVPVDTEVKRDTVTRWDTIPHWYPKPVEVEKVRTEYQWLPLAKIAHDTIGITKIVHDSVLVEVPITSKHYNSPEYDAWVSGYQPSLDSIMVYQKEVTITEVRTISKPPNKWRVNITGGCDYRFNDKTATPFAELGLTFKPSKWGVGVSGGYEHNSSTNTGDPYAKIKLTYDLISF